MKFWNHFSQGLINLLWQSNCPLCQRSTTKTLCENCTKQTQRCQILHPERFGDQDFLVFPWGVYSGSLKRALKVLKYENQPKIAEPLGYWLGETWLKSPLKNRKKLIVVPIPLHAAKLKKRGFNQAELLAESFCQLTGLSLQKHGLERVRDTDAQYSKSAIERKENLSGAFELGKGFRQRRPTCEVLLLDDIYTTGTTAMEAAATLSKNGIKVCGIAAIATSEKSVSLRSTGE